MILEEFLKLAIMVQDIIWGRGKSNSFPLAKSIARDFSMLLRPLLSTPSYFCHSG
jgi:hypothetical protein